MTFEIGSTARQMRYKENKMRRVWRWGVPLFGKNHWQLSTKIDEIFGSISRNTSTHALDQVSVFECNTFVRNVAACRK